MRRNIGNIAGSARRYLIRWGAVFPRPTGAEPFPVPPFQVLWEAAPPPYILLSNRAVRMNEFKTFGHFGQQYGLLLRDFVKENYEVVDTIGPWYSVAGWFENHAITILKRKAD